MSLSGRVGTGNIAGVATAIAIGGPRCSFLDVDRGLSRRIHRLYRSHSGTDL